LLLNSEGKPFTCQDGGTTPLLSLTLPGLGDSSFVTMSLATKSDVSAPWRGPWRKMKQLEGSLQNLEEKAVRLSWGGSPKRQEC